MYCLSKVRIGKSGCQGDKLLLSGKNVTQICCIALGVEMDMIHASGRHEQQSDCVQNVLVFRKDLHALNM